MTLESKPHPKRPLEWFNLRGRRGIGMLAYMGMRISGIALVVYLYLHLVILQQLAAGPEAWNAFVDLAKLPAFLLLDVILIAGILGHGLNGVRLGFVGLGFGLSRHKTMLAIVAVIAAAFTLLSAIVIFFGMV